MASQREGGRVLFAGDDDRTAPVGREAAFEAVQRVADEGRREDVLDGDQVSHHRPRHLGGPASLSHRHRRELLLAQAEVLHVPEQPQGELGGRGPDTVDLLELLLEVGEVQHAGAAVRPPTGDGVADDHHLGHACLDGGRGVVQV